MRLGCLVNNERVKIFGIELINAGLDEVSKFLEESLKKRKKTFIATPNTEIVMEAKKDLSFVKKINDFDVVVADGIGLVYGSRIRKHPLKERVTGYDLSMKLLETANKEGYSLFLLGANEGVAALAAEKIKEKYPRIKIAGTHNGYFSDASEVLSLIDCDILFVGMGFPKQENFLYENREKIRAVCAIGNGGVLNILAGNQKRAPMIFQKLGLEWFYRLLKEPKRITRQWKLPLFLLEVISDKNSII